MSSRSKSGSQRGLHYHVTRCRGWKELRSWFSWLAKKWHRVRLTPDARPACPPCPPLSPPKGVRPSKQSKKPPQKGESVIPMTTVPFDQDRASKLIKSCDGNFLDRLPTLVEQRWAIAFSAVGDGNAPPLPASIRSGAPVFANLSFCDDDEDRAKTLADALNAAFRACQTIQSVPTPVPTEQRASQHRGAADCPCGLSPPVSIPVALRSSQRED